jgi:hypothetical protein
VREAEPAHQQLVIAIAGHEHHRQVRAPDPHEGGQFGAGEPRHDHVGEHGVHRPRPALEAEPRLSAVLGLEDLVARAPQQPSRGRADQWLIVHDQQGGHGSPGNTVMLVGRMKLVCRSRPAQTSGLRAPADRAGAVWRALRDPGTTRIE